MAGAKNKQALIQLLSPVHWRRRRAPWSRSWSIRATSTSRWPGRRGEAYRFLKDVPVLEESGMLVRLPDWWKKRPAPASA